MDFRGVIEKIATNVCQMPDEIEGVPEFLGAIVEAPRIYVYGAGRSGLISRSFAMRLAHLKKETFVVGETVTPAMRKGDVLLVISGSGETSSVVNTAKVAKKLGGNILAVTSREKSSLAEMTDKIVRIHAKTKTSGIEDYNARQLAGVYDIFPMGSMFELRAFVFLEACVPILMELLKIRHEEMKDLHANLE